MSNSGYSAGNVFDQSSAALRGGMGATGAAGNNWMGMATYNPSTVNDPNRISGGMSHYMNPYENQVVGNTMNDISRLTAIQQNANAANAVGAGAFGGARNGIVEALTNSEAQKNMGDFSSQLRQQGFNTAASLSGQDIANRMTATGGLMNAGAQAGALSDQAFGMGRQLNSDQMQQGTFLQQLMQQVLGTANDQYNATMDQPKGLLDMTTAALGMNPMGKAVTATSQSKPGLLDYLSLFSQALGGMKG